MVPLSYFCSYDSGQIEECEPFFLTFTLVLIIFLCLGGPGPEISVPVDRFPPGIPVQLVVVINTEGGQSSNFTLIFTPSRLTGFSGY